MKKIFYALSLAVALLTTSCAKDATEDILNGGNSNSSDVAMTTITVGIDNAATKTTATCHSTGARGIS